MVEKKRIHRPPPVSTPREAPWRQVEEIVDGLKGLTQKLDIFISIYTGAPLPPPVVPAPPPGVPAPPVLPPLPLPPLPPLPENLDALLHLPLEWGKATGGSKNKLTHMGKSWADNIWAGFQLAIVGGEGAGQVREIDSNDRTSLTPTNEFDTDPDRSSLYVIRYLPTSFYEVKANKPAFTTGQKDVTNAGTAEQLDDVSIPAGFKAVVQAKPGNTNYIYFGNSKENAESSSARFDKLGPGDGVELQITNFNLVWIDADDDGEGVSYFVEQDE